MSKTIRAVLLATATLLTLPLHAAPVTFSLDAASFAPGAGYGVDAQENGGKLLDVLFTPTLSQLDVVLDVGQSFTFNIGTVGLREPDSGSGGNAGINQQELDATKLGVVAALVLTDPLGGTQHVMALGSAVKGLVGDADVDYLLDWSSVSVPFGVGGWYELSFADLLFDGPETQVQQATLTLQSPSSVHAPVHGVPEPAPAGLLGIGLLALALVGRGRSTHDRYRGR
jgi:hypothetical protein